MQSFPLYWREPLCLLATLLPLLAWLWTWHRQRRSWARIADPPLRPWVEAPAGGRGRNLPRLALLGAWLLLCVALAGPRTPRSIPPELQERAAVMAVIDLSASMGAIDERLDRRGRAQALLAEWTLRMPEQLRFGLIVYAGHAHRLLPPTADRDLARHFVASLDSLRLPTMGNALADALELAGDSLLGVEAARHVVLLSDGDLGAQAQGLAEGAAGAWPEARIDLHVVGLGGAEAVGVPRTATEPLRIDGQRIVSRREAAWLRRLAERAGGHYHPAENLHQQTLAELLELPPPRLDARQQEGVVWREWFALPLATGILLLLWASRGSPSRSATRVPALAMLLALLSGGCERQADTLPWAVRAQAALASGDYPTARSISTALRGYDARFAEGVACYRLADYPCALRAFAQAAWQAADDQARGRAVFNLGNSYFRLGDYEQASVLFADAGNLGVASESADRNRRFADQLAKAVRQQLADIAETLRRADWRAAAQEMPDALRDRLAEGIELPQPKDQAPAFLTLSPQDRKALVALGALRTVGQGDTTAAPSTHWVASAASAPPRSTGGLFNRLLPMELGIMAPPGEAYRIEDQQPW